MKFLYRLWYGFEMAMAYLAGNMGDTISMVNHERMADVVWKKWFTEGL
jgi:hypothetical protein